MFLANRVVAFCVINYKMKFDVGLLELIFKYEMRALRYSVTCRGCIVIVM